MSEYLLRKLQVLIHLEGVGHQLKAFNHNQGSYTSKRQGYYAKIPPHARHTIPQQYPGDFRPLLDYCFQVVRKRFDAMGYKWKRVKSETVVH